MTAQQLPKLKPVAVPWMISPSAPFLTLHSSESGMALHATFVGYFKLDDSDQANGVAPTIVEGASVFEPSASKAKAGYRMVRVSFEDGRQARLMHAVSDHAVVPEETFDWSLVKSRRKPDEKIAEFLQRYSETWIESRMCPNPRMYEVIGSPWISELNLPNPLPWHHYLLLGHDEYLEVIARGWTWEPGQPL